MKTTLSNIYIIFTSSAVKKWYIGESSQSLVYVINTYIFIKSMCYSHSYVQDKYI